MFCGFCNYNPACISACFSRPSFSPGWVGQHFLKILTLKTTVVMYSITPVYPSSGAFFVALNLDVVQGRYFCTVMPEVECTELRYHCTKVLDLDLCPEAWANGQIPLGLTANDFVRIDRKAEMVHCLKAWCKIYHVLDQTRSGACCCETVNTMIGLIDGSWKWGLLWHNRILRSCLHDLHMHGVSSFWCNPLTHMRCQMPCLGTFESVSD